MTITLSFNVGERVVYPSHGVGEIIGIESQAIGDMVLQVYAISFPQDKMVLRVPVGRAASSGLRALANRSDIDKIYLALASKPKIGNRMWSRRAQEYESKINSGDIVAVSEVVRDLYRNIDSDRSYSERTIYEAAMNRLASELAILENISRDEAISKLVEVLKDKVAA
jgi:CarD family transcriptional regulator